MQKVVGCKMINVDLIIGDGMNLSQLQSGQFLKPDMFSIPLLELRLCPSVFVANSLSHASLDELHVLRLPAARFQS